MFWELVVTSVPADCDIAIRSVVYSSAHTICSVVQSRFRKMLAREDVQVCLASADGSRARGGVVVGTPPGHVLITFDLHLLARPSRGTSRQRREPQAGCLISDVRGDPFRPRRRSGHR